MNKSADYQARQDILNVLDESYFVEAGAGSGKTTAVVGRMVALIEQGVAQPSEICTITFTKAAANEFYQRMQKALTERINDKDTPDEIKERDKNALNNIDSIFMGTIDAFAKKILEEHPFEAGVPTSINILDDSKDSNLDILEFYKMIPSLKEEKELIEKQSIFKKLHKFAEDDFYNIMNVLLEKRHFKFVYEKPTENNSQRYFEEDKKLVLKVLNQAKHYLKKNDDTKLNRHIIYLQGRWSEEKLEGIKDSLKSITNDKELLLTPDYIADPDILDFIVPTSTVRITSLKIDFITLLNKIDDYIYAHSISFCEDCIGYITEIRRKRGNFTFHDILIYLRDMLKNDAKTYNHSLIRHIQKKYKFFFLDEFQDTDPLQAQIFFYLASDKIDEDYKKCLPRHGSLFIVGDPKQSIYRFKGADISSFELIKSLFVDNNLGKIIYLTENFRSFNALKETFNNLFKDTFNKDGKNLYLDIPVHQLNSVELKDNQVLLEGAYKMAYQNKNDAPKLVASIINKYVNNDKYQITEKDKVGNLSTRCLGYDDFMVLTRGKDALEIYMNEFDKQGIPYHCDGLVKFDFSHSLKLLMEILYVLANPLEPVCLFNLLYNNFFKLNIDEIYEFGFKEPYYKVDVETIKNPRIKEIIEFLQSIHVFQNSSLIINEIIESDFVNKYTSKTNFENLVYAYEIIKDKEAKAEICSLYETVIFLKSLIQGNTDIKKSMLLKEEDTGVHLANIHQVKGLEAKFVICINGGKNPGVDNLVDYLKEQPETKIFEISKPSKAGNNFGSLLKTHQFSEEDEKLNIQQNEDENIRLVYVAFTRAINTFVLLSKVTNSGDPYAGQIYNPFYSKLKTLEGVETIEKVSNNKSEEATNIKATLTFKDFKKSKESSYKIVLPSHTVELSEFESSFNDSTSVVDIDYISPVIRGTIVHKIMERLTKVEEINDLTSLAKMSNSIIHEYCGENDQALDEMVEVIKTIVNGGYPQDNGVPQDILTELRTADEFYSEVPFAYNKDGVIYNGVIDVVYRKGSDWHVIDYKTNKDGRNLDEHYKNQLEIYKEALKEIAGIEADAKTYHIDLDRGN